MMKFKTDSREIELQDFRISDTFSGFLEGTPEAMSAFVRRDLPGRVSGFLWKCDAIRIADPGSAVLPKNICAAYFKSFQGVRGIGDYSYLMLAWFVDDAERSLRSIVEEALKNIEWEEAAMPGNWEDL